MGGFALILAQPLLILGLVLGGVVLKFTILFTLAKIFRLGADQALLLAFALPQVGEFAFVIFAFGVQEQVFDGSVGDLQILARAFDWQDAHDLLDAGVPYVYAIPGC